MTTATSRYAMATPRRRWFRFSLRTLFVVATLLACVMALGCREWSIVCERKAVLHMIGEERDWAWFGGLGEWEYANSLRYLLGDFACASMIGLPKCAFTEGQELRIHSAFPEAALIVFEPGSWTGPECVGCIDCEDEPNMAVFVFQGPLSEQPAPSFDPQRSRIDQEKVSGTVVWLLGAKGSFETQPAHRAIAPRLVAKSDK